MTSKPTITQVDKAPGEDILSQVFRSQMCNNGSSNNNDECLNLSDEEAKMFQNALADESFRALLANYASDISDPKFRNEQDEYIRQLESQKEIPAGKQVLRPKPGFVLKFQYRQKNGKSTDDPPPPKTEKLFVNIVHSDQVLPPTSREKKKSVNQKGRQWSLPYSIGPMRMEEDKGKSLVPTFDCAFHPDALMYASKAAAFKDLVANTAREGAKRQFKDDVEIDAGYRILKGVAYKNGTPPVMVASSTALAASTISPKERTAPADACGSSVDNGFKKGFLEKATKNDHDPTVGGDRTSVGNRETEMPSYRLVEQGAFQISDHTLNNCDGSRRPKDIIFRIDLPRLKTSKEVNLEVTKEKLVLKSTALSPSNYLLDVKLPYPVRCDDGQAKFDAVKKELTVRIPVA